MKFNSPNTSWKTIRINGKDITVVDRFITYGSHGIDGETQRITLHLN